MKNGEIDADVQVKVILNYKGARMMAIYKNFND